ncbi:efflux transporter outer membrane subunit [Pseudomonas sp. Pseusp122]|uniref:efflux transporter outer membrane subunit n=1 Tax=unclassified Pseudomonas TaxID=196821 RepID=UPI0039A5474B
MPTYTSLSKLIRTLHLAMMALLVTACSLAPTYQRPALPVPADQSSSVPELKPAEYGAQTELSQEEQALVKDLTPNGELRNWVRLALNYNRDLRLTALRVKEAQATYHISRTERIPTLGGSVERDHQHFDDAAAQERYGQDIAIASVGVSDFELDFFGRVLSLSEAARHDYLATRYGQQAARSALVAEVARVYLSEQLSAALQVDAQRIDEARQGMLHRVEDQQRLGAASLDDVAVQRVETERSHQQLADAVATHARASQALILLAGYSAPLPQTSTAVELASSDVVVPAWLVDMPSQRLLERFDVRQSEESLKAANANIGAARAAFFPSIKLSTGIGVQSDSLRTLFSSGSGTWLFSPQLNLPLFDGGRNRSNLSLAKVRKQIAVAEYEKTVQLAFREMADVLIERQQVLDRLRSATELSRLAQEKARRTLLVFATGDADRASVLASTVSIAQVDMAWRESRQALLLNRLNIYRVLCGASAAPAQPQPETGTSL